MKEKKKKYKLTPATWGPFNIKCTPCPFPPLKSKLLFMKFNYSGITPGTYTTNKEKEND